MNTVYGTPVVQRKGGETLLFIHGTYLGTGITEPALYRVNLTNNLESLIKRGYDATREWLIDRLGNIVAEEDYSEKERRWAIRLFGDGHPPRTVTVDAPIDAPAILGLSAAGDSVVVALTESEGIA